MRAKRITRDARGNVRQRISLKQVAGIDEHDPSGIGAA
jgi:hypothetical protein